MFGQSPLVRSSAASFLIEKCRLMRIRPWVVVGMRTYPMAL